MNQGGRITRKALLALLAQGEGEFLEFKRTTGELKAAMQSLCAFLNGGGGTVLFGIRPDGTPDGQFVTDSTLRDIAQSTDRFEPAVQIRIRRVRIDAIREVVAVAVEGGLERCPFVFDGRPYERVGSTTRRMAQANYERRLMDRSHSTRRWENEPAHRLEPKDLDRDEVLRIFNIAASLGRLASPPGSRVPEILDRLRLRRNGRLLQASVVLFGREFMPDYPQCELRMARFVGNDKAEFMDQRQVRAPAFRLLEEAELFCQRHFPMPARIAPERLRRVETPLIPIEAMREILVNALIHRDYSIAGGSISLAIFDNRVEVWSAGTYPAGITPSKLSKPHLSVQRNPILADVFHRAGLIEKWGRGTNRVIAMCRAAGLQPPTFEEITGAAVVTFKVNVLGPGRDTVTAAGSQGGARDQVGTMSGLSRDQVELLAQCRQEQTLAELMINSGRSNRTKFRASLIKPLLAEGLLELTIPSKPRSRLQRYRTTVAGKQVIGRDR